MVGAPCTKKFILKTPVHRSSVFEKEIICHTGHLADPDHSCSDRRNHLCKQHLLRLAGGADDHQPEDDFQTCERARLSLGDHLQGRPEPSGCERGVGKRKEGMGRRTEQSHHQKKKEEIFFWGI